MSLVYEVTLACDNSLQRLNYQSYVIFVFILVVRDVIIDLESVGPYHMKERTFMVM